MGGGIGKIFAGWGNPQSPQEKRNLCLDQGRIRMRIPLNTEISIIEKVQIQDS